MSASSKKSHHSRKKSARGAKMLISAAAVAATVGGWVAMAASAASVPNTQAQAPNIPALEISAQSGLDTSRVVDTLAPAAQPRAPLAMTRSSR